MILKNEHWTIKTIDQARDLINQILESLIENKADTKGWDAMLWEFMDKSEFGYCADCEHEDYVHIDEVAEVARENYEPPGP